MNIGSNVKAFRLFRDLTRKRFSEIVGISAGYIEEIESNKKSPSLEILMRISTAFNITISELIGEIEPALTPELRSLLDSAKELSPKQLQKLTEFIKSMK